MSDMSKVEKAKAAREATEHVAGSRPTSSSAAIGDAMQRYLSAEQYHELHERPEPPAAEQEATEQSD